MSNSRGRPRRSRRPRQPHRQIVPRSRRPRSFAGSPSQDGRSDVPQPLSPRPSRPPRPPPSPAPQTETSSTVLVNSIAPSTEFLSPQMPVQTPPRSEIAAQPRSPGGHSAGSESADSFFVGRPLSEPELRPSLNQARTLSSPHRVGPRHSAPVVQINRNEPYIDSSELHDWMNRTRGDSRGSTPDWSDAPPSDGRISLSPAYPFPRSSFLDHDAPWEEPLLEQPVIRTPSPPTSNLLWDFGEIDEERPPVDVVRFDLKKNGWATLSVAPNARSICVAQRNAMRILSISETGKLEKSRAFNPHQTKGNLKCGAKAVAWQTDQELLSVTAQGRVNIWDLSRSGHKCREIFSKTDSVINSVNMSPSDTSTILAGSSDGKCFVLDSRSGGSNSVVKEFRVPGQTRIPCQSAKFSPFYHNTFAASYNSGHIMLWDMRFGSSTNLLDVWAQNSASPHIDWHPTEKMILASGARDKCIKIWDFSRSVEEPRHTITVTNALRSVRWRPATTSLSRESTHVASAMSVSGPVQIWDVNSPYVPIGELSGHRSSSCAAFEFFTLPGSNYPVYFVSCSNLDSELILQDCRHCHLPRTELTTSTMDVSRDGGVAFAVNARDTTHPFSLRSRFPEQTLADEVRMLEENGTLSRGDVDELLPPHLFGRTGSDIEEDESERESELDDMVPSPINLDRGRSQTMRPPRPVDSQRRYSDPGYGVVGGIRTSLNSNRPQLDRQSTGDFSNASEGSVTTEGTPSANPLMEEREQSQIHRKPCFVFRDDVYNQFSTFVSTASIFARCETATGIDDDRTFCALAREYKRKALNLEERISACQYNAKVAGKHNLPEIESVWRIAETTLAGVLVHLKPSGSSRTPLSVRRRRAQSMGIHNASNSNGNRELELPGLLINSDEGSFEDEFEMFGSMTDIPHDVFDMRFESLTDMSLPSEDVSVHTEIGSVKYVESMIEEIVDACGDRGDVQTAATLLCLINGEFRVDSQTRSRVLYSYVSMLSQKRLFRQVMDIARLANDPLVTQQLQLKRKLVSQCDKCHEFLFKAPYCSKCRREVKCCGSICNETLFGKSSRYLLWCQSCGHGGHFEHIIDYMEQTDLCASRSCQHACQWVLYYYNASSR